MTSNGYIAGKVDVVWWLDQVRQGIEYRNRMASQAKWKLWNQWYRGEFGENVLPVNIYFKIIRTLVPRIYFRNPAVSITPRKGQQGVVDFMVMSSLLEQVDNALFDRIRLKQNMKMSVQDAIMHGTGVLKFGYGEQYKPTPGPIEPSEAPMNKKGQEVEYNSNVLPDTPWVLRVPTGRFIVPKGASDWFSCRWACHQERRSIYDVRDDPRYKGVADLAPGVLVNAGEDHQRLGEMIDLFEIRDKKTGDCFIIAGTNTGKPIYNEEDDLQFGKRLPFFPIQFNLDTETFWAVPDAKILEAHQREKNSIRRMIREHRKLSATKFGVRSGALPADEATKIAQQEEVGAVLNFDKNANINTDFKEFQASDIPSGLLESDAMEDRIVQEILGLGINQFGEYAPGSADRSATEANIVNQAVTIRVDERRDTVADVIVDITEHLNHTVLNHWSGEQVATIIGPAGEQVWVAFKSEQLHELEYDVKVDPDSSVPETRAMRMQKALQLYQVFGGNQLVDPMKITRWAMSEAGGPAFEDMMKQMGAQPLMQPGQPGTSAGNPASMGNVIQAIGQRRQGGGG